MRQGRVDLEKNMYNKQRQSKALFKPLMQAELILEGRSSRDEGHSRNPSCCHVLDAVLAATFLVSVPPFFKDNSCSDTP